MTRETILEQRVKELEAQLEQARSATDVHLVRDMLSRAGEEFSERKTPGWTVIETSQVKFWFSPETGQFSTVEPR